MSYLKVLFSILIFLIGLVSINSAIGNFWAGGLKLDQNAGLLIERAENYLSIGITLILISIAIQLGIKTLPNRSKLRSTLGRILFALAVAAMLSAPIVRWNRIDFF